MPTCGALLKAWVGLSLKYMYGLPGFETQEHVCLGGALSQSVEPCPDESLDLTSGPKIDSLNRLTFLTLACPLQFFAKSTEVRSLVL